MKRPHLLAALLLLPALSGCLRGETLEEAPPSFESAGAPLVALHAQNRCGMCIGAARFEHPEWTLFAVYENGRALRAWYNPAGGGEGVKLAPGLRHERAELAEVLLPAVAEGFRVPPAEATAWVADLEKGAVDPLALARLRGAVNGSWRPPSPELSLRGCLDCAGNGIYGRPAAGGGLDLLRPNAPPPEGTPGQQDFRQVMDALLAAEASFRAAPQPGREANARVVRVHETFTVEALDGGVLRGPGRCADAHDGAGRVSLPLDPHSPLPALVVLRALDPASLAAAPVDGAVDPRAHATATADAPRTELVSAFDPSRVLLAFQVGPDGRLHVGGEPLEGGRTVRVEHRVLQERADESGVARFDVVETLTVSDGGNVTVDAFDPGPMCSG